MRQTPPGHDGCRCAGFLDIKALLQKTGCGSSKPLPGARRITTLPEQQHISLLPTSILRSESQHPLLRPPADPSRKVRFDLEQNDSSSLEDFNTHGNVFDTDNNDTFGGKDEGYISQKARDIQTERIEGDPFAMRFKVQHIPAECMQELMELGTMDRILAVYARDIGRLAVNSFRPFRSLYFHGIVLHHLGRQGAVDFEQGRHVCEAAVVLNNAAAPTKDSSKQNPPSLLAFLNLGIETGGSLTMPIADSNALARSSWRELNRARMEYALTAGRLVAGLQEPPVLHCLEQMLAQRCIIRPVFNYTFRRFMAMEEPDLLVRDEALQFQIYSTVREIMGRVHGDNPPLCYVMCTTLFAIAETNDKVASTLMRNGLGTAKVDLCSTIVSADMDEDAIASSTFGGQHPDEPLSPRELLCLLDWEFAAVLGYMLAYRYYEDNTQVTEMRARIGAKAFSVDTTKSQPFPPLLPMQDTHFHSRIGNYVNTVYARWPHGFAYMVIDEAVEAYNDIIQNIRAKQCC
ncbi:hypothetical protein H4R20_001586 [Coemansia guatemalensis]|uniref:Uncharacterized protein n=1 Tax=Coemansia guatemalensis TaxID=2761395 RepID=A0A9W8LUS4_9FUNG|nr:hypothetical protein H4R20_001586 [Coemansia guatemalensis]